MGNAAPDYNDMRIVAPYLDPDRPVTRLEALENGSEWASVEFADWMASEDKRGALNDLLSYLAEDEVVKKLAEQWANQAEEL